ncbi:MAG: hypothetical protein IJJ13_04005 [Lachnospiraceae bacterium]|nr:hypothetical protein [Lachnospiraceae bacterium]
MSYENAKKGIGQIFTAEILALLSAIFIIIGTIVSVVGTATLIAGGMDGAANAMGAGIAGGVVGIIVSFVGAIFSLIGFILYIVGVANASKDEDGFKKAMLFLVLALVCSIISAFTTTVAGGVVSIILKVLGMLFELISTIMVIGGISAIANKLGKTEVEQKGQFVLKLIVVIILISIVFYVIGLIPAIATGVIAGILSIIATVLSIVRYFAYLSLLAHAKNMF